MTSLNNSWKIGRARSRRESRGKIDGTIVDRWTTSRSRQIAGDFAGKRAIKLVREIFRVQGDLDLKNYLVTRAIAITISRIATGGRTPASLYRLTLGFKSN